jgi:hypothetical protein
MNRLNIILPEEKTVYAPGEAVHGSMEWSLELGPRYLELSLFWYTAGKGTRDVGVIDTRRFDGPGALGRKDFSFTLPDGPYSFSGKLISLIWALELTCSPGSEIVRREITVSPTGREILLGSLPTRNGFSFSVTLGRHR